MSLVTDALMRNNRFPSNTASETIVLRRCRMLRVALPGADELRGHGEEGLFYVGGVFGARLQEGNAQRLRVLLCGRTVHHLVLAVALVACEKIIHRQHNSTKKKKNSWHHDNR